MALEYLCFRYSLASFSAAPYVDPRSSKHTMSGDKSIQQRIFTDRDVRVEMKEWNTNNGCVIPADFKQGSDLPEEVELKDEVRAMSSLRLRKPDIQFHRTLLRSFFLFSHAHFYRQDAPTALAIFMGLQTRRDGLSVEPKSSVQEAPSGRPILFKRSVDGGLMYLAGVLHRG